MEIRPFQVESVFGLPDLGVGGVGVADVAGVQPEVPQEAVLPHEVPLVPPAAPPGHEPAGVPVQVTPLPGLAMYLVCHLY